jgi:hypothetical protein
LPNQICCLRKDIIRRPDSATLLPGLIWVMSYPLMTSPPLGCRTCPVI